MADENALVAMGEKLISQVVQLGIGGGGPLKPAVAVAEAPLIAAGGARAAASCPS